jgi:hypothetical protein
LRELKHSFASSTNPQEIVKGFFEQFVEHILVSDYKTLKTHNNPFRFRRQLLSLLKELQFDEVKQQQLIHHYQQVLEISAVEAAAKVHKHIGRIIRIFESVDQRLAAIDEFRFRLEKRVSDTVRYMDKTNPGMSGRLSRVIASLAKRDETEIPPLRTLEHYAYLSPKSVRTPPRRRSAPKPQVIRQQVISPEALELRRLFKEYKERRRVTGSQIETYIEEHLQGDCRVRAEQFRIDCVEDFICFSYVRHLPSLGIESQALMGKYELQFEERYVNVADMVECRDFSIQRKSAC